MVGALRPQTDARAVVEPQTPAFRLFDRDLQPLTAPNPQGDRVRNPCVLRLLKDCQLHLFFVDTFSLAE